uniref:Uncharacterized protein n=1 Tax=Leersia perrieri TaxID=77586 RepID=A0A0D9WW13_9ORYZ
MSMSTMWMFYAANDPPQENLPPAPPHTVVNVPLHLLPHRPMTPLCKFLTKGFFIVSTVLILGILARIVAVDSTSWVEMLLTVPIMLLLMAVIVLIQTGAYLGMTRDFSAAPEDLDEEHRILDPMEQV